MFVPLSLAKLKSFDKGNPLIIVPFRENLEQNRMEQLETFSKHIHKYHPDWLVLIIEQSNDNKKFNRGALLNIGTDLARKNDYTYVIFHDVDLLPLSPIVPYYIVFPDDPIHIGKAWTTKYNYDKFLGGILSISISQIEKINGFPNNFWGWGGEDDAFRERLIKQNINIYQPTLRRGFKELTHIDTKTKKEWKNERKWEDLKEDRSDNGLSNIKYKILNSEDIYDNIKKITVEIR